MPIFFSPKKLTKKITPERQKTSVDYANINNNTTTMPDTDRVVHNYCKTKIQSSTQM